MINTKNRYKKLTQLHRRTSRPLHDNPPINSSLYQKRALAIPSGKLDSSFETTNCFPAGVGIGS